MLIALVVDPKDNVANLVGTGAHGAAVACRIEGRDEAVNVELREDIPANHKFALADIKAGDPIVKYGLVIGTASGDISLGAHVHVHNMESNRGRGDLESRTSGKRSLLRHQPHSESHRRNTAREYNTL